MLTLRDAIETMVVGNSPEERLYGRLLAAIGESMQGWVQDEIMARRTETTDVLGAMVRMMGSLTSLLIARDPGPDPEDVEEGAAILGSMYARVISLQYNSLVESDPEELRATLERAEAQMQERQAKQ